MKWRVFTVWLLAVSFLVVDSGAVADTGELQPVVEAQDDVYRYTPANNGSGPMWCSGSTCLVRIGNDVFASGIETLADSQPLNNCRWLLYRRDANQWCVQQADGRNRTREPSPLVAFPDGRLFLSANPTLTAPDVRSGPARPEILQFDARDPTASFQTLLPEWDGSPPFTEHSYRSFAADGPRREMILFQNIGYGHAEWAFRDADGQWSAGKLAWPRGVEYDRPQPIRVCYPNVALENRAVYFFGVSDIHEPYEAWRSYKQKLTGQQWDYDFRRMFFTWSDDITTGKFHDWVEIASRDKTCGWTMPGDLWVAPDGRVHLLWSERAIDTRLREKFFPDAKQSHSLNYAVVRQGQVLLRRTLVLAEEGGPNEIASSGRFHITPDNRLVVLYYVSGTTAEGRAVSEDRALEIRADSAATESVVVPLDPPFTSFFTATPRGGSPLSPHVDLLGTRSGRPGTIGYARIRFEP